MDRADAAGLGVALAAHGGLLALLTLGLFQEELLLPPADPVEISFVEEVALDSAAPDQAAPPSAGETLGPPEDAAPAAEPVSVPEPVPPLPSPPLPAPRAATPAPPRPAARPQPATARAQPAPQPRARPVPARETSSRRRPEEARGKAPASRGSRLADLDLSGLGRDSAAPRSRQAPGATMSSQAAANIAQAIARQVQTCADRQVYPGPGAERIVTTLNLRLNPDGSLAGPPRLVRQSGTDDENARYARRVADLAIRSFVECAPLRGLPANLYDVPRGWSNFTMNYRMPG